MKINEVVANDEQLIDAKPRVTKSALGSFMRGMGATQGADAMDAYKTANTVHGGQESDAETAANIASNASQMKMQGAAEAAERAKFYAGLKQQADRQGSKLSMSDIGRKIGIAGEYANPDTFTAAVNRTAEALQKQGVTITGVGAPAPTTPATAAPAPAPSYRRTPPATAPLPTIGGIGPSDPRYAALAARTRNAPATPVR